MLSVDGIDITVRRAGPRRVISRDALRQLAETVTGEIRRGAAASVNADGRPLGVYKSGPQKGRPITLRRTGRLLDLALLQERDRVIVRSAAPHARYVERRFGVLGIGERGRPAFEAQLDAILTGDDQ